MNGLSEQRSDVEPPNKADTLTWEWNWPKICWHWHDFMVIALDVSVQREGQHSPCVHVLFMLLGVKLLDFGWHK